MKTLLTLHQILCLVLAINATASFYPYEDPSLRSEDKIYLPHLNPLAMDSLMHQAKDVVVDRRKLEQDLVRHGRYTDMTKRTAVTRHQAVTTTFNAANELEKNQEVFEEMTKLIARKLVFLREKRKQTERIRKSYSFRPKTEHKLIPNGPFISFHFPAVHFLLLFPCTSPLRIILILFDT